MISISLCMILKNESNIIENCLDSVKNIVDEIVIVDTGSTDITKEIVSKYTDKVFDFQWIDNFSAARNFSFSHATKDYILWLDADDVLLEEDQKNLVELKNNLRADVDSVSMIYNYAFDEYGDVTLSFRRNRIVKRCKNFKWHDAIHEYLAVDGNIFNSDVVVTHKRIHNYSDRNIKIYENRLAKGETFKGRDLYYYANELMEHQQYEKAIIYYKQFLNSGEGWVEDNISTCNKLAEIYQQLKEGEKSRYYIYKSFEYDTPRPESCCRLGYQFREMNDLKKAIFWYKLATQLERLKDNWGFCQEAYWTWLPHLQLCICYYRTGDYVLSYHHNEIAGSYRPNDNDILYNRNLLEGLLQNTTRKSNNTDANELNTQKKILKIVQVSPDYYPVPPKKYGGIERVVYDVTEELVRRGHKVYLYASEGSNSSANIIPYEHNSSDSNKISEFVISTLPDGVDIVHDHTHLSVIGRLHLSTPTVCTIHSARNNAVMHPVYASKRALELIGNNEGHFVYHGINPDDYEFSETKEDFLLFLGVLDWHKGILEAIEVAEKTKEKLIIAGPVFNHEYYSKEIEPRIKSVTNIDYIGEVGGKTRLDLLKNAKCMLFPTMCEEPFGLVMIEAMVSGTPVLAFPNGAVPEVLNSFPQLICNSLDEMVKKVLAEPFPEPIELRNYVMNKFTASIMTDEYLKIFKDTLLKN